MSTNDRQPPSDIQAEAALLSLCMIDGGITMRRVAPMLNPTDFASRAHEAIYAACAKIYEAGGIPDVVTVASWLRDRGRLIEAGNPEYITTVLNSAPSTANALAYAKTVRNKSRVRNLIFTCQRIASEGYAPHGEDTEFIMRSATSINDIARIADHSGGVTNSTEALKETFLEIQRNGERGLDIAGLRTGLDAYDRITMGLEPKELTIIGARPSVGKSARVLQIADAVASSGVGVLFFSLEMTRKELMRRQISMRARVDGTLLKMGKLTPDQWRAVTQASKEISSMPLWIDDRSDPNIYMIRERALGAMDAANAAKKPIGLIVADYLQRVPVPKDTRKQRYEQISEIARGFKQLAKEADVSLVVAAQIKRISDGTKPRRPTIDDLREGGDIEQEADRICLIHREHVYNRSAPINEAEMDIAKSRNGATGLIKCRWVPELTLFEDLPEDPYWSNPPCDVPE